MLDLISQHPGWISSLTASGFHLVPLISTQPRTAKFTFPKNISVYLIKLNKPSWNPCHSLSSEMQFLSCHLEKPQASIFSYSSLVCIHCWRSWGADKVWALFTWLHFQLICTVSRGSDPQSVETCIKNYPSPQTSCAGLRIPNKFNVQCRQLRGIP